MVVGIFSRTTNFRVPGITDKVQPGNFAARTTGKDPVGECGAAIVEDLPSDLPARKLVMINQDPRERCNMMSRLVSRIAMLHFDKYHSDFYLGNLMKCQPSGNIVGRAICVSPSRVMETMPHRNLDRLPDWFWKRSEDCGNKARQPYYKSREDGRKSVDSRLLGDKASTISSRR